MLAGRPLFAPSHSAPPSPAAVRDLDGRVLQSKTMSVNQPLRFGGVTAYQTDWSMSALQLTVAGSQGGIPDGTTIQLPMANLQGGWRGWRRRAGGLQGRGGGGSRAGGRSLCEERCAPGRTPCPCSHRRPSAVLRSLPCRRRQQAVCHLPACRRPIHSDAWGGAARRVCAGQGPAGVGAGCRGAFEWGADCPARYSCCSASALPACLSHPAVPPPPPPPTHTHTHHTHTHTHTTHSPRPSLSTTARASLRACGGWAAASPSRWRV